MVIQEGPPSSKARASSPSPRRARASPPMSLREGSSRARRGVSPTPSQRGVFNDVSKNNWEANHSEDGSFGDKSTSRYETVSMKSDVRVTNYF